MNTIRLSPTVLLPWMILPFLALINFVVLEVSKEDHQVEKQEGSGLMTELPEAEEAEIEGKFQAFRRQFKAESDATFMEDLDPDQGEAEPGNETRYTTAEKTRLDSLKEVWDRAMRTPTPRSPRRSIPRSGQLNISRAQHTIDIIEPDSVTKGQDSLNINEPVVIDAASKQVFYSGEEHQKAFHGAKPEPANTTARGVLLHDQQVHQGDRVQIQLATPLRIREGVSIPSGTLLYGQVGTFASNRVQITIPSVTHQGQIHAVHLTIQDVDGGLGLFVPSRNFLEVKKEVSSSLLQSLPTISTEQDASLIAEIAGDLLQQGSRSSSRILSKAARKNKATLLGGTIVYIKIE